VTNDVSFSIDNKLHMKNKRNFNRDAMKGWSIEIFHNVEVIPMILDFKSSNEV